MITKLSIRQISVLTALDRDTVTRRLHGLPSELGAKNARMYDAPVALRAVLAPASGESTLEQIKLRTETLNAQLKEVELAKKTKDLIPAGIAFGLINLLIKYIAGKLEDLRAHGKVDREWIAKCESRWLELYHEFVRDYDFTSQEPSPPALQRQPNRVAP